ncbi:MAG: hypothetical protein CL472_01235 [Acidobacteria bacterium]|nr:hypothetical protein [Acidobacteriota bacterium]
MSCDNFESGQIKIPASEWAGLKKTVRDAYNREQARLYSTAVELHEEILRQAEGVRNVKWLGAIDRATTALSRKLTDRDYSLVWKIFNPEMKPGAKPVSKAQGSADRPKKPLRKTWPDATNRQTLFTFDEAAISFDDKTKTLTWRVSENNRAVERAHAHPVAEALFEALNRIKWTRGSGGEIVGNDEINIHEGGHCAGGGGAYVTYTFPPPERPRIMRRW